MKQLDSSIWVFDGKGAKIIQSSTTNLDAEETPFHMHLDFYPLGVLLSQGIIIGIQQQLILNASLDVCQFGVEIKVYTSLT